MHPTTLPTLLVLLVGTSAIAQSALAEDALVQSGAVVSYPVADSSVKTPAATPEVASSAPQPVVTPAPVVVAPAVPAEVDDEEEDLRPPHRIRALLGVTDWHWEEGTNSKIVLVEGGMIPSIHLEYAKLFQSFELGGGFSFSYGAIEYDGALQDGYGNLVDYKNDTHYSIADFEAFVFASRFLENLNIHTKGLTIEPGVKYGFQSWIRTIGSKKSEEPGEYGYVETWNLGTIQPVIALRVPFGSGRSYARLEAGARIPLGNANNEISKSPMFSGDVMVHPKPQTGYRVQGIVALGHVVLEVEYLAQDFNESDRRIVGGVMAISQPDSYLDRLDARIGLEF